MIEVLWFSPRHVHHACLCMCFSVWFHVQYVSVSFIHYFSRPIVSSSFFSEEMVFRLKCFTHLFLWGRGVCKWVTAKTDHKYLTLTGLLGSSTLSCCTSYSSFRAQNHKLFSACTRSLFLLVARLEGLAVTFLRWEALGAFSLSSSYSSQRLAKQRAQWQVAQILEKLCITTRAVAPCL